jgi:hypothetical protein
MSESRGPNLGAHYPEFHYSSFISVHFISVQLSEQGCLIAGDWLCSRCMQLSIDRAHVVSRHWSKGATNIFPRATYFVGLLFDRL